MPLTNGFYKPKRLARHFNEHGSGIGAATEAQYLEFADAFLGSPFDSTTCIECTRLYGDVIRLSLITGEFGIMTKNRKIKTYYVADPSVHKLTTNLAYFHAKCQEP